MQTNHHCLRVKTNRPLTMVRSPLAGDFSSAIASKLASYSYIVPV
jgi:hypothetical protein